MMPTGTRNLLMELLMGQVQAEQRGAEVEERTNMLPLVRYNDGTTGLGVPGAVYGPAQSAYNMLTTDRLNRALMGDDQAMQQSTRDSFDAAGLVAIGGLTMPRPRGSIGMGGNVKATRPEPSGLEPQGRSYGGGLAETAENSLAQYMQNYKDEFDSVSEIADGLWYDAERAIAASGLKVKADGRSSQSPSRYLTVEDGDRLFKLRLSDHPDRHGSDHTVRFDGLDEDIYANAMTGERIGRSDFDDLQRYEQEDYEWAGSRISRDDYERIVSEAVDAALRFAGRK